MSGISPDTRHGIDPTSGLPPAKRGRLESLDSALDFLAEVREAMRHCPVKQHDRTPEQQRAVEDYTAVYVWIGDVLQAHGRDVAERGRPAVTESPSRGQTRRSGSP